MRTILSLAGGALLACAASAGVPVQVDITGTVLFNSITAPPLSGVTSGQSVLMSFLVNSNTFEEDIPGDVRAYNIDRPSFSMNFSGGVSVGLLDPFPGEAYFGVIDGFPVSDGFFVSSSTVSPGGVALEQTPFNANVRVGYVGTTLSSLDILDAVGSYDFTGLTSFEFTLWNAFPDNVRMEIEFSRLTITAIPGPATLGALAPLALAAARRRRA